MNIKQFIKDNADFAFPDGLAGGVIGEDQLESILTKFYNEINKWTKIEDALPEVDVPVVVTDGHYTWVDWQTEIFDQPCGESKMVKVGEEWEGYYNSDLAFDECPIIKWRYLPEPNNA